MLIIQIALGIVLGYVIIKYPKKLFLILVLLIIFCALLILAWLGYWKFMENIETVKVYAYLIFGWIAFCYVADFVWSRASRASDGFQALLICTAVFIFSAVVSLWFGSVAIENFYGMEMDFSEWLRIIVATICSMFFLVLSVLSILGVTTCLKEREKW